MNVGTCLDAVWCPGMTSVPPIRILQEMVRYGCMHFILMRKVNIMTAGFASVVAFVMILIILGVSYFRIGEEQQHLVSRTQATMKRSAYDSALQAAT